MADCEVAHAGSAVRDAIACVLMAPKTAWIPNDEFLFRVKRAYGLALAGDHGKQGGGIWSSIDARRSDIHAALLADRTEALSAIFADPLKTDLYYGMDNLCRSILGENSGDGRYDQTFSDAARQDFDLLTKALGLGAGDCEAALAALDALLDQRIDFPAPFRGELGLKTSRGPASLRAVQALYQTHRLLALCGGVTQGKTVVEIGPGMGRTAYYGYRAGLDYTTIDLPIGMVGQACFLGAALGPDKIWMEGDDLALAAGRIKLLPANRLPPQSFDVAVNVDSLTEMRWQVALDYAKWISGHAHIFLSINHRKNYFSVAEIAALAFAGVRSTTHSYPVRDGYYEEMFDLSSAKPERRVGNRLALTLFQIKLAGRRIKARLHF